VGALDSGEDFQRRSTSWKDDCWSRQHSWRFNRDSRFRRSRGRDLASKHEQRFADSHQRLVLLGEHPWFNSVNGWIVYA